MPRIREALIEASAQSSTALWTQPNQRVIDCITMYNNDASNTPESQFALFPGEIYDKDDLPVGLPYDQLQEFLDPIHGFVEYTGRELQVIDHPAFQRLFNVYQLAQTHLVFRGATHHRGDHALGAIAALELLISAIEKNWTRNKATGVQQPQFKWAVGPKLSPLERDFARLAVLFHDIGHIAAGHTLEDELGLLHAHDSRKRLEIILRRKKWRGIDPTQMFEIGPWGSAHLGNLDTPNTSQKNLTLLSMNRDLIRIRNSWAETLEKRIDRLYDQHATIATLQLECAEKISGPVVGDLYDVSSVELSASQILLEIVTGKSKTNKTSNEKFIREVQNPTRNQNRDHQLFRLSVLQDPVSNTVCADIIDYLQRDWENIGKARKFDARLLQFMEIRSTHRESSVVVNLRPSSHSRNRSDVVSAIVELLENRYHLWEIALLHRTKTCASAMLERAIIDKAEHAGLLDTLIQQAELFRDKENDWQDKAEIEHYAKAMKREIDRLEMIILDTLLDLSDTDIYSALNREIWIPKARKSGSTVRKHTGEVDLFSRLHLRMLHKEIVRVDSALDPARISKFLAPLKAPQHERFLCAHRRLHSMRLLEKDFELAPGSLVMYCLPYGLGRKLAEVKILYDDNVELLTDLDSRTDISGGSLAAQLRRYDNLWRASLFASREAQVILETRGLVGALRATFKRAILGMSELDFDMYDTARLISATDPTMTYATGRSIWRPERDAPRDRSERHYPSGEPTLRSHFWHSIDQ